MHRSGLAEQLGFLNSFSPPLLYTPGDNEWTDCHRASSGGYDPRERLDHIRKTYFADPATTFGGQKRIVTHQGGEGFPENTRLKLGDLTVITAHVVGSNNGFEIRELAAAREFHDRNRATIAWLREGFAAASADQARAVIVAIHADMFEFDFNEWKRERWLRHSGFGQFGEALKAEARRFGRPVLLIFGDSHRHRVFRPFENTAPNALAMQVFGYPSMDAVRIVVDTDLDAPFSFFPIVNPAQ